MTRGASDARYSPFAYEPPAPFCDAKPPLDIVKSDRSASVCGHSLPSAAERRGDKQRLPLSGSRAEHGKRACALVTRGISCVAPLSAVPETRVTAERLTQLQQIILYIL